MDIEDLTVALLRLELRSRSLPTTGRKQDLITVLSNNITLNHEDPHAFHPKSTLLITSLFGSDLSKSVVDAPATKSLQIDVPPPPPFKVHQEGGNTCTRWEKWKRSFEIYLGAKGSIPDGQKKSLLLHVAGSEVQEVESVSGDQNKTYEECLDALSKHFNPEKNVRFERFNFRQAFQEKHESTDSYVVRLRKLSETCKFQDADDHILDQLVEKCCNSKIRERWLSTKDLTLAEAQNIARTMEASRRQANVMEGRSSGESVNRVHSHSRSRQAHDENKNRRGRERSPSPHGARFRSKSSSKQKNSSDGEKKGIRVFVAVLRNIMRIARNALVKILPATNVVVVVIMHEFVLQKQARVKMVLDQKRLEMKMYTTFMSTPFAFYQNLCCR